MKIKNIIYDILYLNKYKELPKENLIELRKKIILFRKFFDKIPLTYRKQFTEVDKYLNENNFKS